MGLKSIGVIGMAIILATDVCQAQTSGVTGDLLPVAWKVEQTRSGHPTVTGQLENRHVFAARGIQLLVEELDGSGKRVSQAVAYIDREVPPGGRTSFQVRVPRAGATYRVSLLAVDWFMQAP